MQEARALLIIGIWVAVLPYLGFPVAVKNILFVATGFSLIYFSLLFYKQSLRLKRKTVKGTSTFSESNPEEKITSHILEV